MAVRAPDGAKKVLWTFSMAYNVIPCKKFAKNTKILKIADFAI